MAIVDSFKSPSMVNRAIIRWWFPDAGADLEKVAAQLREIHEGGYGGVSVTMVPQFTDFDAAEYGWGTPRWKEIIRTILKTGLEIPGFTVDLHPTAHWPSALNTVLPNDDRQAQELVCAFRKIKKSDTDMLRIPMPETKTNDMDAEDAADYIFQDKFVALTVAQVASVDGVRYTLKWDSMADLTRFAQQDYNPETGEPAFTPAGIPEHEMAYGDMQKLADKQYYYSVDANVLPKSDNDGDEIGPGDWLIFGAWHRGTAQAISGRGWEVFALSLPMAPKMYCINNFAQEGVNEVIRYWEENIMDDEIRGMMCEMGKRGAMVLGMGVGAETVGRWSPGMERDFLRHRGYSITPYLPLLAYRDAEIMFHPTKEQIRMVADGGQQVRLMEDFWKSVFAILKENAFVPFGRWARKYNYGVRSECDAPEGEASESAFLFEHPAGQNLYYGKALDNFRNIASGAHLGNRNIIASEMCTEPVKAYALPWNQALEIIHTCMCAGVNKCIFHGASYDEEVSGKYSQWPGWHAFQFSFADSWGRRHPSWTKEDCFSDYLARTQAVLQGGVPRVDLYVLEKTRERELAILNETLALGYTYDVGGDYALFNAISRKAGDRLAADGPAYKALIVRRADALSMECVQAVLQLAKEGFPIIVLGELPVRLYGMDMRECHTDAQIREVSAHWLSHKNVIQVMTEGQIPAALKKLGITPDLPYESNSILSVEKEDEDGTRYYYLYNSSDKAECIDVALEPGKQAHVLDAYNGDIYHLEGTKLTIMPKDALLLAVGEVEVFGETAVYTVPGETILELDDWLLTVESWGPAGDPNDPCACKKTPLNIGKTELGYWDTLDASQSDLDKDGSGDMHHVSGIGYYTTVFDSEEEYDGFLVYEHGEDMILNVTINGVVQPRADQAVGYSRIHVVKGENILRIEDASTLKRRVNLENPFFGEDDFQRMFSCIPNYSNAPAPDPAFMDKYGLTHVKVCKSNVQ